MNQETIAEYLDIPPDMISQAKLNLIESEAIALIKTIKHDLPASTDEWPQAIQSVLVRITARVFRNDIAGITGVTAISNTAGDYSQTKQFSDTGSGVWLSKQDKQIIRGGHGRAYEINTMEEL